MCRPVIDLWMRRPGEVHLSYISNDEEIAASRLVFGGQEVKFNDKVIRWLWVWLDSKLSFDTHIKERVQRAKAAEARIKGLTRTHGLPPGLVRKIQIAAVQAIAFFWLRFLGDLVSI